MGREPPELPSATVATSAVEPLVYYIERHGHGQNATCEGGSGQRGNSSETFTKKHPKNSTVQVRHSRKTIRFAATLLFAANLTRKRRRDVTWPYTWSDFLSGRTPPTKPFTFTGCGDLQYNEIEPRNGRPVTLSLTRLRPGVQSTQQFRIF